MTDREKTNWIKKGPYLLPDQIPAEVQKFLERDWNDRPETEKELFYTASEETPGTIAYTFKNTLNADQRHQAAAVLSAVRTAFIDQGGNPLEFDEMQTARDILFLLER